MTLINSFWWNSPRLISSCSSFTVYVGGFLEARGKSSKTFLTNVHDFFIPFYGWVFYILLVACCTSWTYNPNSWHSLVSIRRSIFPVYFKFVIKWDNLCLLCNGKVYFLKVVLYVQQMQPYFHILLSKVLFLQLCDVFLNSPAKTDPLLTQSFLSQLFFAIVFKKSHSVSLESFVFHLHLRFYRTSFTGLLDTLLSYYL